MIDVKEINKIIVDRFSDLEFDEPTHVYTKDGREYLSATTFLGQFEEGFDSDKISLMVAKKNFMNQEDVLLAWQFLNEIANLIGSIFHQYNEDYYNSIIRGEKNYVYGTDTIFIKSLWEKVDTWYNHPTVFDFLRVLNKTKPKKDRIDIMKKQFMMFYSKSSKNLIPVATELRVYDTESLIAGTFDKLFYSLLTKLLHIFDWKTNKEFTITSAKRMLYPISHVPKTKLHGYSLQLNLYKYILMKYFPELKFGDSWIVWFNENNNVPMLYKAIEYQNEIVKMLDYRKKTINNIIY